MNADLIAAAALFGPGALALPAITIACRRSLRRTAVERAVCAEFHTTQTRTTPTRSPVHEAEAPATVTDLTTRRRIA